ncbi:NFX1-type zinc finger-containing protein 1 [Holothuria leucospilota]|uniref:NFX1-type zinc finger-containing protein 1 n=1 Tax=Holothuria leucospilota TaxID=206669 RepID=A0A9Q1HDL5_HOLLE|nr:NFX1-type zinc finger-containing protein 1 [Holothuria leucospilota]
MASRREYPRFPTSRQGGSSRGRNPRNNGSSRGEGPFNHSSRGRGGGGRGGRSNQGERSERNPRVTYPMGMTLLTKLETLPPAEVVARLYDAREPLEKLLDNRIPADRMRLLVDALGKACSIDTVNERVHDILLLLHEKSFLEVNLSSWISTWTVKSQPNAVHERNLHSTVLLLTQMLHTVPDCVSSIGVMLILLKENMRVFEETDVSISTQVASKLSELRDEHSVLLREGQEMNSRQSKRRDNSNDAPPEDFRELSILPNTHELQKNYEPFLRTNIVNGRYDNVHHYLDIHFRLLREDFVQPLREGIAEYTAELARNKSTRKTRFQNFRLYEKVRAIEIKPTHGGVAYVLQFNIENHLKRVKWELSRRLIYGSLVCLSTDNFKSLIFGVVANRDPKELKQGKVEVTFNVEADVSQKLLSCTFQMAESSSYFEAYRHVLHCLQNIDQYNLPFSQYLVYISKYANLPQYIKENTQVTFDMSNIAADVETSKSKVSMNYLQLKPLKEVRVSEVRGWPSAEVLGFDDSQMEAYKSALREEVCLIQGPPGTGKTYVGLKIVQTLLLNRDKWGKSKPLLVVCYTNHALDQFLEGILEFEKTGIVRIGGRSSSEKMKELNLNQVRRSVKSTRWRYATVREQLKECAQEIQQNKDLIETSKRRLLKRDVLHHVMTKTHRASINVNTYQQCDVIATWLCIFDEVGHFELQKPLEPVHPEHTLNEGENEDEVDGIEEDEDEITDEDEELDRRFLDDEEDFLFDLRSRKTHRAENIAIHLPKFDDDQNDNEWRVAGPRRPKSLEKLIERRLSENDVMTEEESERIINVWSLDVRQRWRLYRLWIFNYVRGVHRKLRKLFTDYERQSKIFKELKTEEDLEALKGHSVIGVTTTGAAKYNQLLKQVGPPIIVVEEAAEILEAHVITSLSSDCQHLILIGDHQQLRPNPTVYKLCKDYNLDVSLFERLIRNGMPCHRLSLQHRMRPEISHLLKIHKDFYPGLLDHEMVKNYDQVRGIEKDLYFIEHDCQEQHDEENKSRSNLHEATFLTALCKYLLQQGYGADQITILTAYKGQVWNFKNIMDKRTFEGVRVCPIDNFQGEENDIILFSFVRSNEEGSIGFLKVSNRICVALSRAKKGLYCVGNFKLMSEQSELWKTITADLRKRQLIGPSLKLVCRNHPDKFTEVSSSKDFKLAPDGGCSQPCTARLDCGHTCQKKCHPEDKEHRKVLCMKPCAKILCDLQHKCALKCCETCPTKCRTFVKKLLPCSHEQMAECSLDPEEVRCYANCERKLLCGHRCQEKCWKLCTEFCSVPVLKTFQPCGHRAEVPCSQISCPEKCTAILKCDHVCQGTCGECKNGRLHVKCKETCKRILVCGHPCDSKCSQSCPPCKKACSNRCQHNKCERQCGEDCVPCREPCQWRCKHQRCLLSCGSDCMRSVCNKPCDKKISCGHFCIGICGEPCPTLCRICDKEDVTTILFGNEDELDARVYIP